MSPICGVLLTLSKEIIGNQRFGAYDILIIRFDLELHRLIKEEDEAPFFFVVN